MSLQTNRMQPSERPRAVREQLTWSVLAENQRQPGRNKGMHAHTNQLRCLFCNLTRLHAFANLVLQPWSIFLYLGGGRSLRDSQHKQRVPAQGPVLHYDLRLPAGSTAMLGEQNACVTAGSFGFRQLVVQGAIAPSRFNSLEATAPCKPLTHT